MNNFISLSKEKDSNFLTVFTLVLGSPNIVYAVSPYSTLAEGPNYRFIGKAKGNLIESKHDRHPFLVEILEALNNGIYSKDIGSWHRLEISARPVEDAVAMLKVNRLLSLR